MAGRHDQGQLWIAIGQPHEGIIPMIFLLIRKMTTDGVLAGEGGTLLRTSFDEAKENAFRKALAKQTPASVGSVKAA
jgi:uncharacterized membrane protein